MTGNSNSNENSVQTSILPKAKMIWNLYKTTEEENLNNEHEQFKLFENIEEERNNIVKETLKNLNLNENNQKEIMDEV